MTYFGFLALFLAPPILVLALVVGLEDRRGRQLPAALRFLPAWQALAAIVVVAVLYTTPWDNYLVATRVWWYDPALVTGFVIGWVPIEEYAFFVLQPILAGLVFLALGRRLAPASGGASRAPAWGRTLMLALAALMALMAGVLLSGWEPGTYLALELVWALPPILFQLAFGWDIIWRVRRPASLAILTSTIYLSAADALAIGAGTWTIDPAQSLRIYLGGVLPLEELVFFFLTNVLCVFGLALVLSPESLPRAERWRRRLRREPVGGP